MVNTYRTLALNSDVSFDSLTGHPHMLAVFNGTATDPASSRTTVEGTLYEPQYYFSILWIIVDFISCSILLAATIAAFVLRKKTITLGVFRYVTILTRGNSNIDLPPSGWGLSSFDRATLLKDVVVRIGDVNGRKDVGIVGLSCT